MNTNLLLSALIALSLGAITVTKALAETVLVPSSQVMADDVNKFKARQLPAHPKLGLALGGGGSRGAATVAVLEVLEREGLHFDYIAGTSVGAIVGGLYDAGVPIADLKHEFLTGRSMHKFSPIPFPQSIVLEPLLFTTPRLLGFRPYDGLYPGIFFRKYLTHLVPAQSSQIENLKVPFAAVSMNLIDGKPYMIRGGSLVEAMRASSAVPGLRKPVELGKGLFVDGGVSCNLPVKQCRDMGADIVIAVNVDEPYNAVPLKHFRRPGSVTKRMIKWSLYNVDIPQEELADIVIHPDASGVGLVTASKKAALKAYDAGRVAAEKSLPELRSKLQEFGISTQAKILPPKGAASEQ